MPDRRRVLWGSCSLAVYAALAFALFHSTWEDPGKRLVGLCCDTHAHVSLLRWTSFAVLHGYNPLFSDHVLAPEGINLLWQPAAMPLVGLVVTPLQELAGAFVTFNLVTTFAFALSGWTCYLALRRWVGGFAGPFAGGLLYGFSPFMGAHGLGHTVLISAFLQPLFLLALTELVVYRRWVWWKPSVCLGLLFAGQFLVTQEGCAALAISTIIALGALAASFPGEVRRRAPLVLRGGILAVGVALTLLAVPLGYEFFGPQRLHGLLRPQNTYVADLANLVVANPLATGWAPWGDDAHRWGWSLSESTMFVGPILLAFVVFVTWRGRHDAVVRVSAAFAAVMGVLALGPSLHVAGKDLGVPLPWWLFQQLPLLENLLPARLTLYVYLGIAVLVAVGVRNAVSAPRRSQRIGMLAWAAAGLLLLAPPFDYPALEPRVPEFFRSDAVEVIPEGTLVFVAPYPRDDPQNMDSVLWQVESGMRFRMPGGNVLRPSPLGSGLGTTGGGHDHLTRRLGALAAGKTMEPVDRVDLVKLRQILTRKYQAEAALVGPMQGEAQAVRLFTRIYGEKPRDIDGIHLWLPERDPPSGARLES
jgi:hypothetical protein